MSTNQTASLQQTMRTAASPRHERHERVVESRRRHKRVGYPHRVSDDFYLGPELRDRRFRNITDGVALAQLDGAAFVRKLGRA